MDIGLGTLIIPESGKDYAAKSCVKANVHGKQPATINIWKIVKIVVTKRRSWDLLYRYTIYGNV